MKELIFYLISTFSLEFKVPVDDIKIYFVDSEVNQAWCEREYDINTKEVISKSIKFNKRYWSKLPAVHKRELVYHELGHCALGLKHVKSNDIMRPADYATKLDGSNWPELLKRMKKQIKNKSKLPRNSN